jgi:hypothetical protein
MHRAVFLFGERTDDAGRGTGRILAMHALQLDEGGNQLVALIDDSRCVPVDHGIGAFVGPAFSIQHRQILETMIRLRQTVDPVTGLFTFPAADAAGQIHQAADRVGRRSGLPGMGAFIGSGHRRAGNGHIFKKVASVQPHRPP